MSLKECAGCGCLAWETWPFGCPACDDGLLLDLAGGPYRKFESGIKTVEVRDYRLWLVRAARQGRPFRLRWAYRPSWGVLTGRVGRVWVGLWKDAPEWARRGAAVTDEGSAFFRPDGRLILIEFSAN